MSCYLRHLGSTITKAGIVLEKGNRKQVDKLVRAWSGQEGVKCNEAWKVIKVKLTGAGEDSLIEHLKTNIS